MKPIVLKYITLSIGVIYVLTSAIMSLEDTRYIKPIFHVVLYAFYYVSTKKINPLLIFFLISGMVAEYLTAVHFSENYYWVVISYISYFAIGITLISPVLKTTHLLVKNRARDMVLGFLILAVSLYVIYIVLDSSIQQYQVILPSIICGVGFIAFVGSCILITWLHPHPNKVNLFIVGVGYFIVCVGYLVYELLLPSVILMMLVNTAEVIAQFFFVVFLIHRREMLVNKKWFI